MKKIIIFATLAFALCVPALAVNDSYFSASPFSYTDYFYDGFCEQLDSSQPVYFYAIANGTVRAISETQNAPFQCGRVHKGTGNTPNYSLKNCNVAIGDYYGADCFTIQQSIESTAPSITVFPSGSNNADISAAFADFLANSSSPDSPLPTSFTVPRGNVLYFQVASNSDVNFVSHFSENSGLFSSGNVYGPWGDTYQRISSEASLPGPGIEFPRSGSDAIVWGKGEPLNVLGQTKVGVFTKSCSAGTYYAFYNPAYQSISGSDGFGSTSVGSNVTVSGNFSFIRIYSLQQLLDISTSTNGYDDYYVGTPDGNGGVVWVDQDDQVNYPSSGGENQEDEPISSVSLIESIKRILRNILSEIESIFTFGFSAIRDLVDLMDEFVATFDDLYEWLPEECYTLLIACVSVAIAIGVFKVFL